MVREEAENADLEAKAVAPKVLSPPWNSEP